MEGVRFSEQGSEEEKKTDASHQNDAVQSAMGKFGRWQLINCLSLSMTRAFAAWHHLSIVFEAPPMSFECTDSQGSGLATRGNPCWSLTTNDTLPDVKDSALNEINVTLPVKCQAWTYDESTFTETIISEWDLVCDREQLTTLAQSTFMLGNMFGDILFGILADRFGRKRPLIAAVVLLILSGIGTSFVPWFELLLVLKFTTAVAVGGTMVTSFVLCMECVGGRWRMIVATLYHLPYGIGYSVMALIAFILRDWRTFQLAISLPPICMLAYCW